MKNTNDPARLRQIEHLERIATDPDTATLGMDLLSLWRTQEEPTEPEQRTLMVDSSLGLNYSLFDGEGLPSLELLCSLEAVVGHTTDAHGAPVMYESRIEHDLWDRWVCAASRMINKWSKRRNAEVQA